jgi:hypothetical protein
MTTRIIECFDVQHWDGGERHNHHAYIVDENDAKVVAGEHGLLIKRTFVIHDNLADYQHHKSDELKRTALAKLTPEERIVLGL